ASRKKAGPTRARRSSISTGSPDAFERDGAAGPDVVKDLVEAGGDRRVVDGEAQLARLLPRLRVQVLRAEDHGLAVDRGPLRVARAVSVAVDRDALGLGEPANVQIARVLRVPCEAADVLLVRAALARDLLGGVVEAFRENDVHVRVGRGVGE